MHLTMIVVDDEPIAMEYLLRQVRGIDPEYEAVGFTDPFAALAHVQAHPVDIAFLDIEMYGMTGIELAKRFKDADPGMSVIFVTGFTQYAVDAFSVHACGYLLKPPEKERIRSEIALAMSRAPAHAAEKRIRAQTFGSFEMFVDGTPVKFGRSRSKELLAYLVDRRGAGATVQELIAVLFEDRDADATASSLLRNLVSDMIQSLRRVNADEIIQKSRNSLSVDTSKFECDYYDFLAGDVRAINAYAGEYMVNYSWAEFTTGMLDEKANLR